MTERFTHKPLGASPDEIAPDGSEVRTLAATLSGGMGHWTIPAGHTLRAVRHKTVDEIWYFISGEGEMWRSQEGQEEVLHIVPEMSVTIPVGTAFQVKNPGPQDMRVIGQTMPPWPGNDEAVIVDGPWTPTVV